MTIVNTEIYKAKRELQDHLNKISSTVAMNTLCPPIGVIYHTTVNTVNVIAVPAGVMIEQIKRVLNNKNLMNALKEANNALDILNEGMGVLVSIVDGSIFNGLSLFSQICPNFSNILSTTLKKFISATSDIIKSRSATVVKDIRDDFDFYYTEDNNIEPDPQIYQLPDDAVADMKTAATKFKLSALSKSLSENTDTILSPLIAYKKFIKTSGILTYIKILQDMEKCMTDPNTCNRPKKELHFPNTHKYNSEYYLDMLCVDMQGNLKLGQMIPDLLSMENKLNKTLTKIDEYLA